MRWLLIGAVFTLACGGDDDTGGFVDAGRVDAALRDSGGLPDRGPPFDAGPGCVVALPVDLLWVIDNSNSMQEEQNNLALNFATLIDVLTSPPDDDGDGTPDRPPLEDLRVGVVSTDVGTGADMGVQNCDADGDDGALVSTSRATDAACSGVTTGDDPWLDFRAGDDADAFAEQFACIARLGVRGCGLEQQLESAYRALGDRSVAPGPNSGFVRDESLVAVIYVTDEDDCSASDTSIFDPDAMDTLGPFSTRCADHPELLHPVSRYVTQLEALRPTARIPIVVGAITGVPRDLVGNPSLIDYDALLADERMQFRRDPLDDGRLEPACSVEGVGSAMPARRIVEVVQGFAERGNGIVQSICADDFRPALEAIAELIASRICPPPI